MSSFDAIFAGPWGPVVIFGLRIVDVSLSTLRILLSVRGRKVPVPLIGFLEVLVWIFAVGNAIRYMSSGWHVLGYAGGFSAGTVVGVWLEGKLAIGVATMQVITRQTGIELGRSLRALGCGVTQFTGQGREGPVEVFYTVVPRRRIPDVLGEIDRLEPDAFVTIEEPREIRRGWLHSSPRLRLPVALQLGEWTRRAAARQLAESRAAAAGPLTGLGPPPTSGRAGNLSEPDAMR